VGDGREELRLEAAGEDGSGATEARQDAPLVRQLRGAQASGSPGAEGRVEGRRDLVA